ncbi:MAG: anti-sigma-F factor Fin [Dethiobacteria bacterium]
MKVTYICDICGEPLETIELAGVQAEELGLHTLRRTVREDIIKYNDEQGLLLYSLCSTCLEKQLNAGRPVDE